MSAYPPPNEENAIFNKFDFTSDTTALTISEAKKYFLTYPNAQGTETFGDINVGGTADVGTITYPDNTSQTSAYTGGTAGTYTSANITIDSNGKISSIASGSSNPNVGTSSSAIDYTINFTNGSGIKQILTDATATDFTYNPSTNTIKVPNIQSSNISSTSNLTLETTGTGNLVMTHNGSAGLTMDNNRIITFDKNPQSASVPSAGDDITNKTYVDGAISANVPTNIDIVDKSDNVDYTLNFSAGSGSQTVNIDGTGGILYNPSTGLLSTNNISVRDGTIDNVLDITGTSANDLTISAITPNNLKLATNGLDRITISDSGVATFTAPPECSVAPTTNDQLTNKLYVDTIASTGTVNITTKDDNVDYYPTFVDTTGASNVYIDATNNLTYNPLNNRLTTGSLTSGSILMNGGNIDMNGNDLDKTNAINSDTDTPLILNGAGTGTILLQTAGTTKATMSNAGVMTFNSLPQSSAVPSVGDDLTNKTYVDGVVPTNVNIGVGSAPALYYPTFVSSTGNQQLLVDNSTPFQYNPNSNNLIVGGVSTTTSGISLGSNPISNAGTVSSTTNTDLILNGSGTGNLLLQTAGTTKATMSNAGVMTFNNPPECSTAPTTNNQLTNKAYVDAVVPSTFNITDKSDNVNYSVNFSNGSGNQTINIDSVNGLNYNPSTNVLTAGTIYMRGTQLQNTVGLTGTSTGDLSLSALSTNNLKLITNGIERVTIDSAGVSTFSVPPECSTAPTTNNQLTNKSYVDTAISSANANVVATDSNLNNTYYPTFVTGAGTVPLYCDATTTTWSINPNTGVFLYSNLIRTQNNGVYFGYNAGGSLMSDSCVNLGRQAGEAAQNIFCVAIGRQAGQSNQGLRGIAIGAYSGNGTQGSESIAIGYSCANSGQASLNVAVGSYSGQASQGARSVVVGAYAGQTSQGISCVALGYNAGNNTQSTTSIAIGDSAGQTTQGAGSIAIGHQSGQTSQGASSTSVGYQAGNTGQGTECTAIGYQAGQTNQVLGATAVGFGAGNSGQLGGTVAVGYNAGQTDQGTSAVAIGANAGNSSQGTNAVAIGRNAGQTNQHFNTIILNGTGTALNSDGTNRFFVKPIRGSSTLTSPLYYNTSTGEITTNGTSTTGSVLNYLLTASYSVPTGYNEYNLVVPSSAYVITVNASTYQLNMEINAEQSGTNNYTVNTSGGTVWEDLNTATVDYGSLTGKSFSMALGKRLKLFSTNSAPNWIYWRII